jgi:hypothetical protein
LIQSVRPPPALAVPERSRVQVPTTGSAPPLRPPPLRRPPAQQCNSSPSLVNANMQRSSSPTTQPAVPEHLS